MQNNLAKNKYQASLMTEKQRTLKSQVTISGVGLHTGVTANLTLCPAQENFGYKFQRIDI